MITSETRERAVAAKYAGWFLVAIKHGPQRTSVYEHHTPGPFTNGVTISPQTAVLPHVLLAPVEIRGYLPLSSSGPGVTGS
jgi:hypothetical protein